MWEQQAEELRELMAETQKNLKELYDAIDEDDRRNAEELEFYRAQEKEICRLLNSCGIPSKINGKTLSVLERISIAVQAKVCA